MNWPLRGVISESKDQRSKTQKCRKMLLQIVRYTTSNGQNTPRQSLYRYILVKVNVKGQGQNAKMPKSFFGGNSAAYGFIYFTPKLLFSRVRVTDVVRCPCSDFRHVVAPYKLSYY